MLNSLAPLPSDYIEYKWGGVNILLDNTENVYDLLKVVQRTTSKLSHFGGIWESGVKSVKLFKSKGKSERMAIYPEPLLESRLKACYFFSDELRGHVYE